MQTTETPKTKTAVINCACELKQIKKGALITIVSLSERHLTNFPKDEKYNGKTATLVSNKGFIVQMKMSSEVVAILYGAKIMYLTADVIEAQTA